MNDEPELKGDLPATVYLERIARELTTIRRLVNDAVQYTRGAEREIPEFMRRFMDYMHDVSDVRYMYESLGHQAPQYVRDEAARCDDRLRQLLEKLHTNGEAFEKIRREMAADPNNRWDHTKQLTFRHDGRKEAK